ncbi:uncharacterized protein [Henckelia pumila]|uniref:uncharacterized protein n=1 Tax=Henckelia pumila TaxID=405737 RepID=UPI003C6E91F5
MNFSLSDDDSDRDQEQNDEEDHTSLAALLKEKRCFQFNPLGVASDVATPGQNTSEKSVYLNTSTFGNFGDQEAVNDDITLECVQEFYEELYADRIKQNNLNTILSKENSYLKFVMVKLEVILDNKNLEFCNDKGELKKVTLKLVKFNSSTFKLDFIMGKDGKAGLGLENRVFEVVESSKPTVFVKKSSITSRTPIVAPPFKNYSSKERVPPQKSKQWKRHFICHYCFKPNHIRSFCFKTMNDYIYWKSKLMFPPVLHNTRRNTTKNRPTTKKIWVPKFDFQCFVVYTSLKTNIAGHWYLHRGSSRHITGLKEHLMDHIEQICGKVTYGGGAK